MNANPEHISLELFSRYLRSMGWQHAGADQRASSWRWQQAGADLRIALPIDPEVADYAEAIVSALRVVAFVEGRSIDEVAADVRYGGADVVSVRLTPETPSGEAPLTVAAIAVRALKDLVVGTAAGLEFGSVLFPSRRPRAERYAQQVRLSTSPGSFIVSLSLPLYEQTKPREPAADQTAMDETVEVEAQPFGRLVSARMRAVAQSAVSLAIKAAEEDGDITLFESDPMVTGNAKELAALAELGGQRGTAYELRFSQSPLVGVDEAPPSHVRVEAEQRQLLLKASDRLRALKPKSDITIAGHVVSLTRESIMGPGVVVVRGIEHDGPVHRYRVYLSEDQYTQADRAHMQGLSVSARGNLAVHGNFLVLQALDWFTVQQPLPEE